MGDDFMCEQKPGLLNSWKEIASYLNRGVRTVQRWERMGLPVRRLGTGPRAPVIANAPEIDGWMQTARAHGFLQSPLVSEPLQCRADLRETILQSRALRQEMAALRKKQRTTMAELMCTICKLKDACSDSTAAAAVVLLPHHVDHARMDHPPQRLGAGA